MRNLVNMVSTLGALVMAATPLAAASVAHAQTADVARIRVADLDLSRADSRVEFERRVTAASNAVCRPAGPTELARVAACRQEVGREALAQLRQLRPDAARSGWVMAARPSSSVR